MACLKELVFEIPGKEGTVYGLLLLTENEADHPAVEGNW